MDGARFANAVVSLGVKPKDLTWKAGVDVLSLGGTKNGVAVGEAVVFFNHELARDFDQFSDIGYTLGTILLRQHNDVEVGLADNILKNLSGSCRVAASDPMAEDGVEKRNPHFRRGERQEFIEGDTK